MPFDNILGTSVSGPLDNLARARETLEALTEAGMISAGEASNILLDLKGLGLSEPSDAQPPADSPPPAASGPRQFVAYAEGSLVYIFDTVEGIPASGNLKDLDQAREAIGRMVETSVMSVADGDSLLIDLGKAGLPEPGAIQDDALADADAASSDMTEAAAEASPQPPTVAAE